MFFLSYVKTSTTLIRFENESDFSENLNSTFKLTSVLRSRVVILIKRFYDVLFVICTCSTSLYYKRNE
jgi:hypothetical protein